MLSRLRELARRLWYLVNRRRLDEALRREMEAHPAEMGDPRRFGNLLKLGEEARDVWGWRWLDDVGRDFRLGLRTLRRSPGFTLTAIVILSLGIGVNLAFFQIVNATMLQSLRVKDPDTLVRFYRHGRRFVSGELPYQIAEFVAANNNVLSSVLMQREDYVTWSDVRIRAGFVSAHWFSELGGVAGLGRVFARDVDEQPDAAPVVVLSHEFWQRNFDR